MSTPPRKPSGNIGIWRAPDIEQQIDEEVTREILTSGVLAVHSADLSRFKSDNGEFKKWLQIFHVANRPTFNDTHLKVTSVLPWCHPGDEIDIEFHRAVNALNGYRYYPLAWKSFSWIIPPMANTPTYAVFTPNPSQWAFFRALQERTGSDPKHLGPADQTEFWDAMKPFVIVPRQGGGLTPLLNLQSKPRSIIDAYSGSSEVGPESLREW